LAAIVSSENGQDLGRLQQLDVVKLDWINVRYEKKRRKKELQQSI
jgi:hypothetical protein